MTCGDLFAGIGGLSLGLERAGFRLCWQVERDPYCETVLARHWPHVTRRQEVRFAGAANLARVDLIAGGFPCSDVSKVGKHAGLAGLQSRLWHEFHRIAVELRPCWLLIENVPALRVRGADTVLGQLEAEGYACWPLVVGAEHIDAPHRRERVWITCRLRNAPPCRPLVEHPTCAGLEGARQGFPARPDDDPHGHEPARLIVSRMGGRPHGISQRLAGQRQRAAMRVLGNAVVPQCAELLGRSILTVERSIAQQWEEAERRRAAAHLERRPRHATCEVRTQDVLEVVEA